jgi:hypothetical protein
MTDLYYDQLSDPLKAICNNTDAVLPDESTTW